jgi:flagellar basal-body rod protein FlgG
MIRGLYAAASGMVAQIARQDTYAHNLANVSSVGFRGTRTVVGKFADSLATAFGASSRTAGAVHAAEAGLDPTTGPLMRTDRPYDLALSGSAFLTVQTVGGVAYTRDGQLQLDVQRRLVTRAGQPVLGQNGPIVVPSGDMTVDEQGVVFCQGQRLDALRLAEPERPQPAGDGLYTAGQVRPATQFTVSQGMLEQSNVNAMQEMSRMLNGFRLYEANATALRYQDQSLGTLQKVVE